MPTLHRECGISDLLKNEKRCRFAYGFKKRTKTREVLSSVTKTNNSLKTHKYMTAIPT